MARRLSAAGAARHELAIYERLPVAGVTCLGKDRYLVHIEIGRIALDNPTLQDTLKALLA